jgi:hypothetical protein
MKHSRSRGQQQPAVAKKRIRSQWNNGGIVYQKDFGLISLKTVKNMELYNPDPNWHQTNDEWPQDVAVANQ